jgi:hypothetical protein
MPILRRPARGGRHHLHQARGAHARARIHDEAAFLADQAIDIGRVQPDGLGALRVAEGHGEALLQSMVRGAFAGVDAAVPHLALAGQVGGGQQFAVAMPPGWCRLVA